MTRFPIRTVIALVVMSLFGVACSLPSLSVKSGFDPDGGEIRGIFLLLFGPVACSGSLPWFANIALFDAMLALRRHKPVRMLCAASIAILLALIPMDDVGEHGSSLHGGYWFWLASMVAALAGAVCLRLMPADTPDVAPLSEPAPEEHSSEPAVLP